VLAALEVLIDSRQLRASALLTLHLAPN